MAILVPKTFITTCNAKLIDDINADVAIVPTLEQIIVDPVGNAGVSDFWFSVALSGAEDTALDAKLTGWACPISSPPDAMFDDAVRYSFSHASLSFRSWMNVGSVKGDKAGYSLPFDATIIGVAYQQESGAAIDLVLIADGASKGTLITSTIGTGSDMTLSIDANKGDLIQLNGGVGGIATDISVDLYAIWR